MTIEQFDEACNIGYPLLVDHASKYLEPHDAYSPRDIVHNALLEFRVKRLGAFEWRSQAEWEKCIKNTINLAILKYRENRAGALDFHVDDAVDLTTVSDDALDPEDLMMLRVDEGHRKKLDEALKVVLSRMSTKKRQVVLGLLAGFDQVQMSEMLGITQQGVSWLWKEALRKAYAYIESVASDENR